MPLALRKSEKRFNSTGKYYSAPEYKNLPWKELKPIEAMKSVAIRLGLLSMAAGTVFISLPNGPVDVWGDLPSAANRDDQLADVRSSATAIYSAQTMQGKFSLLYINPIGVSSTGEVGGNGILGAVGTGGDGLSANVGQVCLSGSAYDTTPSEIRTSRGGGDISAVAAFAPHEGGASVYPAGSDAPALKFSIDDQGMLIADQVTAQTLTAYGCEPGLGLYEKMGNQSFSNVNIYE